MCNTYVMQTNHRGWRLIINKNNIKVIKQFKWRLLRKLYGLAVGNEPLTPSLTNFHSCFSSSHHISHSSAASSTLSHFSHRATVVLSRPRPSLSVTVRLRGLRTRRSFINSSLADARFATKALSKKKDRRNIKSINFSQSYKL